MFTNSVLLCRCLIDSGRQLNMASPLCLKNFELIVSCPNLQLKINLKSNTTLPPLCIFIKLQVHG